MPPTSQDSWSPTRTSPASFAATSSFLHTIGANIVSSDQYSTDPEGGKFFLRMEFGLPEFISRQSMIEQAFGEQVASRFAMEWRFSVADKRRAIALFVSRYEHCLLDLLWRWRRHELNADVVCVVSNHRDLEEDVLAFGVPFHHVPVRSNSKHAAEARMIELVAERVDLVVLARYMQILSARFLERVGAPVINIHHSFLPAFVGADPYGQARERGVKLIGATAHYTTEELDAGPIIEQDVVRVSHRHDSSELELIGRDIERVVLSRAVKWHLDDRVIIDERRTVVFGG
jgi:formyltetrahydrofolate deformylase